MKYSVIIPVYNRPDEADELLESLAHQSVKDFEVVIVEDGSTKPCKEVAEKYANLLDVRYFTKSNGGPGPARNFGVERAQGEYVLILDSDCVLPEGYMAAIDAELKENPCDAFGGPDAAHESFTNVQKAISYSMTSFFTTGGIRGGKKKGAMDKFYPRSFNMGVKRSVYNDLGGFSKMRFGEDIDFSYRIVEAKHSSRLFPEAWVWHKRRTDMRKFFKQVFNSGIARINLEKRHPGTMKLVHMLPMVFTVGVLFLALIFLCGLGMMVFSPWLHDMGVNGEVGMTQGVGLCLCWISMAPILFYSTVLFVDSTLKNYSVIVGFLSVPAAFVQLMGYGFGFIKAWWLRCMLGQDEFTAFEKNFYD
ncbi:MAG: glycosyltransferase [Prevotellaceae bacterium]|nr:glycosyltransferase [Candidatus Minthosoma caballi]